MVDHTPCYCLEESGNRSIQQLVIISNIGIRILGIPQSQTHRNKWLVYKVVIFHDITKIFPWYPLYSWFYTNTSCWYMKFYADLMHWSSCEHGVSPWILLRGSGSARIETKSRPKTLCWNCPESPQLCMIQNLWLWFSTSRIFFQNMPSGFNFPSDISARWTAVVNGTALCPIIRVYPNRCLNGLNMDGTWL